MQPESSLSRPDELNSSVTGEIGRFLRESGLTFCELLTLARGANGSNELLHRRLTTLGVNADHIDLAALNRLASHSADDVALYAQPAAWPSHT